MWSLLALLVALLLVGVVIAQPEGWRMKDRFFGFRYELHGNGPLQGQDILLKIQREADAYSCFGWTQISPAGTVVGEARCSKARGPLLMENLRSLPEITRADMLVRHFVVALKLLFAYSLLCLDYNNFVLS